MLTKEQFITFVENMEENYEAISNLEKALGDICLDCNLTLMFNYAPSIIFDQLVGLDSDLECAFFDMFWDYITGGSTSYLDEDDNLIVLDSPEALWDDWISEYVE